MKLKFFLLVIAYCCCNSVFGENTNVTATYEPHPLPSGRTQINVRFAKFFSEDYILNPAFYSVTTGTSNTPVPIVSIGPLLPETNIAGVLSCKGVYLIGNFIQSESNKVNIKFPTEDPIVLPIAKVGTNDLPWYSFLDNGFSFEVMPFDANGGGGIGLQYAISYNRTFFHTTSNSIALFLFNTSSKGQFGVTSGSSTSNRVQDSLNAEADLRYLINLELPDPVNRSNTNPIVYPAGILVSPIGFEWNREFTLGNYAPKIAAGGAIPYLDYPAMLWSHAFKLTNAFTPPTLFSGISYVAPLNGKLVDPQASKVRERWDTELIYDLPILNKVSFRFTWNSYVGVDHTLWRNYYQVGAVYYIEKSDKTSNGIFFGYGRGSQPPNYIHTGSWLLGYNLKLQ